MSCPHCGATLNAKEFVITGMRSLAEYACADCGGEFYGDLPAGQAFYTPFLLDKKSGAAHGDESAAWFGEWLEKSYRNRTSEPLRVETRRFSVIKDKVILLNCLDTLYGHSLLKLLNAQRYLDRQPDFSLIVIAPPFLEWMIPDGAAEAWIVDLPLSRGTEWNDWLAAEIARRLETVAEVFLSRAFSHPSDFDIERFTRVAPFALENFASHPRVTFIWREDRLWAGDANAGRLKRSFGLAENSVAVQIEKVARLAETLRAKIPKLDFAVAGLGASGRLPEWIADLRKTRLDTQAERAWCERYAASQVVVGVHGSNMLLPSAHAGGVVELLPEDRQGNFLQDILVRPSDARETLFRYRFAPLSTTPEDLARIVEIMLRYEDFRRLMSAEIGQRED